MLSFPFSLLLLPATALLGVVYVTINRLGAPRARAVGRVAILALTWTAPLATRGPGLAQLIIGLLSGYLGIRMVALGERWKSSQTPPRPAQVLAAMVTPEELFVRAQAPPAGPTLLRGLGGAAICVGLLIVGNRLRLWRTSRAADDLLVFVEVAVGTWGVHHLIVGLAKLRGRGVAGLLDQPILSASFSQFWGRRWNRLVQGNLDRAFFRPYSRRGKWIRGTLAAFGASGIMHVIAVLDAEQPRVTLVPSAAVMGFFLIHAGLVLAERRLGWHRQPKGRVALLTARVRTIGLFIVVSPLLLDPFASVVHVHGRVLGGETGTATTRCFSTPRRSLPSAPRQAA